MTGVPPTRLRVAVEDARPEPDPARTGCLWVGGILGVVAGVVFVFFGVPPLLNFLFPGETVAVGETYEDEKLALRIERVAEARYPATPESRGFVVSLAVEASSSWSLDEVRFVLKTDSGEEFESSQPMIGGSQVDRVPQGPTSLLLTFITEKAPYEHRVAKALTLHVSEPNVKFVLPEPTGP